MKPTPRTLRAQRLADETETAYSFDRYASWPSCAAALMRLGLNDQEVKAILLSKWMRWAADASPAPYGRVPAKAIVTMIQRDFPTPALRQQRIRELVVGTFGGQEEIL